MVEGETPDTLHPVDKELERWGYETHFKPYLLLLARKSEQGLEASRNFPKSIELSPVWHETLNLMRQQTLEDGLERFAPIGYKEPKDAIFLPDFFIKGGTRNIPPERADEALIKARKTFHIEGLVGDIHSHPPLIPGTFRGAGKVASLLDDSVDHLSIPDFHSLTNPHDRYFLSAVVGTSRNFMAFRASDTLSSEPLTAEAFTRYWEGKLGSFSLNPARRNSLAIAQHYHLVLYQGKSDQDLRRIYP